MVGSGFRRYRSVQSIPTKPHTPHPTASDMSKDAPVFDDALPVELLELVRTFRKTVEGAIMGADKGSHFSRDEEPSPCSNLKLSPFAGSELSHACTDLVRYVAQLLKQKKDEYDELFLKHRHWKRAPQSPHEEARARTVGPMVLTSLYGMAESLLSVTGADRAIVYMHNPSREELVGIVYSGGNSENVMEVPITLKASRADVLLALASSAAAGTGASLSSCGVPKRSPIDPVVLAYSLDAGINIGDMEAAKSVEEVRGKEGRVSSIRHRSGTNSGAGRADVSVEPHGPLSGYTVHNMLCVPISLPESLWGHSNARDGKSKTIGVLQLLNKLKHTPAVNSTTPGSAPQFTAVDEGFAHNTSLSMGSLLRWGTQGVTPSINDLDFLSLESRRLSVDLQRLSHTERVRCRDHDGVAALKLAGATPKGGGSKSYTHSESKSLKKQQTESNELNGATHRHFVVGEILDNVTKEVEKQKVSTLSILKPPSGGPGPKLEPREAISLTNTIFSASPLPRRHGPLLVHRVAHTDDAPPPMSPIESGVVLGTGDICAHVVGASQAIGHLREAWTYAHHSSQEFELRVKHLEESLASEKQQRRKLELFVNQSGLVVPPSLCSAIPSSPAKDDPPPELPSNLNFLQARIQQLKLRKGQALTSGRKGVGDR